jgi:hypothetical protein
MTEQSLKWLAWQLLIGIATSFIVGALMGALTFAWMAILGALIVLCLCLVVIYTKNKRLIKLLLSGWFGGCYYTFPTEENPRLWAKAEHSIKYLGISSATIIDKFRDWAESLPQSSTLESEFLLMSPEAKALPEQEAYRLGRSTEDSEVAMQVSITKQRIHTSIQALKALDIYRKGRLKIRLYDEVVPWWIYIIDDKKAFIGVLEKGKSSLDAPVLILNKHPRFSSIFDAYHKNWGRMWGHAGEDY